MASAIRSFAKRMLLATLAVSVVLTLTASFAQGLTVDTTTAKSNETSTNNVLGDTPTRVTWEAVVGDNEQLKDVTVQLPQGSKLSDSDSDIKVTVLDGTTRLSPESTVTVNRDAENVQVSFAEPLDQGLRLRVEMYSTSLPNVNGEVHLTGSYTDADGQTGDLGESPAITVTAASATERISNWLDEQPWVQAWNSVTFLRLFFQPQIVVESIPTVATGWLISLALVLVGFPLAIPLGLIAAFMKLSKVKVLHGIAAIYTGIIRGTPLFLQIYIAFFGLPLLGVPVSDYQYVFAVLVMAFNSGAYMCEILRAGIQSIPRGQFEASRSLGMTSFQTMFSVIIPQMVRRVIPTMTSEFILLYKDTSLLAAVGVMELMLYSRSIVSVTGNMTPYIVAAVFYLIVTLPLIHVVTVLERRLAIVDNGGELPKKKRRFGRGKKLSNAEIEKAAVANAQVATVLAGDAPVADTAVGAAATPDAPEAAKAPAHAAAPAGASASNGGSDTKEGAR